MDATESPDLGITDIESLLAQATEAFSGERTFAYEINGKSVVFTYTINPSASLLLGVREGSAKLASLKPEAIPPTWRPFIPKGISPEVATRIAWAEQAQVKLGGKALSQLDLLKLCHGAGTLFILMTDEIAAAATGAIHRGEAEVVEALGETYAATGADSPS